MWRSVKVLWCSWLIFSRALDLWLTLEENSCFGLFTQVVHVYDPRHLEWASLSESLSSRLFSGVIQPQHFGFFQTSGSFWSTGQDPFSTLGDYVWHQTKPYTFFFHVPHRWFRNEEMRSAAEGRLKEYNKPALSWVTSKEYVNHVYTKNTKLKFPVVWGVFW